MSNNRVLATLLYKGKVTLKSKEIDAQATHLWTLSGGFLPIFNNM